MNKPISNHTPHLVKRWLALCCVCCSLTAMAQTQVEYFWNVDPGYGKGTIVNYAATVDTVEVAFNVSTENLTAGVHKLGMRTITLVNGNRYYSPNFYGYVVKEVESPVTATRIEYFWDKDPGYGKGQMTNYTVSDDTCDVQFHVNTSALTEGLHRIGLRTVTTAGERDYYSPTLWSYVMKPKAAVYADRVEYYWDNDPGHGKATQVAVITGNDPTDVSFDVNVEGLSEGVHRFCFRSYAAGGWSPTVQYYVRIKSGEPQLITAIEYYWDTDPGYGKGIAIPFTPATMVNLNDIELNAKGLSGDHLLCIRAKSRGGWSPLVTQMVACTAEGAYTLNEQLAEGTERNFRSLNEMFTDFSTRRVSGNIDVTLRDGATFAYDATNAEALAMLTSVAEDLVSNEARITLMAASKATVNITANEDDLAVVIALCAHISLDKVILNINGVAYDFSVLAYDGEELCSGSTTTLRAWSAMSEALTVSWTATATSKAYVLGYTKSGTEDLPAMTLTNTGAAKDYVKYAVSLSCGETQVYSFDYTIYVNHTVAGKSISFSSSTPKDGVIVNPGAVTVSWSKVDGATSYEMTVERTADSDGAVEITTTELTKTSATIQAETGYSYIYKVRAIGPCDVTAESGRGFTLFRAHTDDLAALKVLYDACGGKAWSKQWNFDAEVMASTNYPGVTFSAEGRVTAIDLSASGVTGMLPIEGFELPELTSLNLSNNALTGKLPTSALNLPALTTLNLSRNQLTGNIPASLFSKCSLLTTLSLAYNQLTEVEAVLPAHITSLGIDNQFRVYGKSSELYGLESLDAVEIQLKKTFDPDLGQNSLMKYNHSKQDWSETPTFDLYDADIKNKYARLKYDKGYYHLSFIDGDYKQPQDAELIMVATDGSAKSSVQPVVVSYVEADANVDRLIDVLDVQHTLNYVVAEKGAEGIFNWSAANTYEDDQINIQDIVVTVNYALDQTNEVARAHARRMNAMERAKAHGRLYVENGYLMLEADTAVAALDMELQGVSNAQLRLMLHANNWQMMSRATDEGVRLMIFSPTGETLSKGVTKLLALRAEAYPIAAEAADSKARALTIAVEGGNATGLDATELTEAISAHIWDGVLHVVSNMECEHVSLSLYDPAGRLLLQLADVTLHMGDNMWYIGVDIRGFYLLQVRTANGTTDVMRIAAK